MSLGFPATPTIGTTKVIGNRNWMWDGTAWVSTSMGRILAGYASFGAAKSGAQGPLTINIDNKLIFTGAKAWDPDNTFDNVNSKFTAPITGVYEFLLRLFRPLTTDTTEVIALLYKNAAPSGNVLATISAWEYVFGHSQLLLNAGDVIEVYCKPLMSNLTINGGQFYGKLIRTL